jgi:hypothetical protein
MGKKNNKIFKILSTAILRKGRQLLKLKEKEDEHGIHFRRGAGAACGRR